MNYDDMPAGPEIDRLVAELLGWRWGQTGADFEGWCGAPDFGQHDRRSDAFRGRWSPSANIAHAWEAMESDALNDEDGFRRWYFAVKETALGYEVEGYHKKDDGRTDRHIRAAGDTAPLAICRALLKASGDEAIAKCDHRGEDGPGGEVRCMDCNMVVGPNGEWIDRQ